MKIGLGIGVGKNKSSALSWSRYWTPSKYQEGEQFDNGKLVLTFDDGWKSIYDNGLPLFQEKGISVTCYLNSGVMGVGVGVNQKMSWSEALAMQNAGMDMQCHTTNHEDLPTLTKAQIEANMVAVNQAFVANGLISPVHHAYPSGNVDDKVIDAISAFRKTGRNTQDGSVTRKTSKYDLVGPNMPSITIDQMKLRLDVAKINKTAVIAWGHKIGVIDPLSTSVEYLTELIDYAKSIGIDIISLNDLYNEMLYTSVRPLRIVGDDQIDVYVENNTNHGEQIKLERSDDNGLTYSEIAILNPGTVKYSDTGLILHKNYYYRARAFKGSNFLPYSGVVSCTTALSFPIEPTGDSTGVATLKLSLFQQGTFTLDGDAKFYDDVTGTTGETNTKNIGRATTYLYFKCTTGGNLKMSRSTILDIQAWTSPTNAPKWSGDIGVFVTANSIVIGANNSLSGDIGGLININKQLFLGGTNTVSGSINRIINALSLEILGSNTVSGDPSEHIQLCKFDVEGNSTVTLSRVNKLKSLSYLKITKMVMPSALVNQLLADMWANKDEAKPSYPSESRYISLTSAAGTGAPTGQGLIDKASLQTYRSPNNEVDKPLWTVNTR